MSSCILQNQEFKQFIWQRIQGVNNQKLCAKLRGLSKKYVQKFEKQINCADVKYENLEKLATSNFAAQIHRLKLSVPGELTRLVDLWYISTKYFVSIQSVNLRFVNSNPNIIQPQKILNITSKPDTEKVYIRGLTIKSNQQVQSLQIEGWNHKLQIFDTKFDGLELYVMNIDVEILSAQFLNSPRYGLLIVGSISNYIQDIFVSRCLRGLGGEGCSNIFAWNLKIQQCVDSGCAFRYIDYFQIENTNISGCPRGLHFDFSHGRMRDMVVKECKLYGVLLNNARIRYKHFQFMNNAENDVEIDDYHNPQNDNVFPSEFIQEV